ncbi:S-adenosylmethionine-dependent methyltransferase [Salix suchowensis]|nr:S-adenosylmethionine-dependent methyltransferase [Salix suchowensis]
MAGAVQSFVSLSKALPMNGGHGLYSYANNSTYQNKAIVAVKDLITEAIAEKLDTSSLSSSNTICITEMGCSVGPNTFVAVQNIVEAVLNKYRNLLHNHSRLPEFLVFLNDHALNDFNTLFTSLPPDRNYYVAGVPGSFHGRLFPADSLHIVHTSYALQWLSQVPEEVEDVSSPAWNKGRVYYSSAGDQTVKAYEDQFARDLDCFLHARAKEVVCGGLIMILVPGRLNTTPHDRVFSNISYDILGSCLMDMAKMGITSEEKVDSFNIPIYFSSPRELEATVEKNGYFSLERLECLPLKKSQDTIQQKARAVSYHIRAGLEFLLKEHFGNEIIMDELFDSFNKNLEKSKVFELGLTYSLFALLKRKAT